MARATNLSAVRQMLGPGLSSIVGSRLALIVSLPPSGAHHRRTHACLATLVLLPMIGDAAFVIVGQRSRQRFTQVQEQFGHLSRAREGTAAFAPQGVRAGKMPRSAHAGETAPTSASTSISAGSLAGVDPVDRPGFRDCATCQNLRQSGRKVKSYAGRRVPYG